MRITLSSRVPVKRKFSRLFLDFILLLVAFPVIVIASVSIAMYYLFARLFSGRSVDTNEADAYHVEVPLLEWPGLKITLVEDELDQQLTAANEEWIYHVYDEETYLFRVKTKPLLPALEDKIGALFLKEVEHGIILQLLSEAPDADDIPNTKFVFLDRRNLQVARLNDAGPFFLYNSEKQHAVICGFNKKEKVEFRIENELPLEDQGEDDHA